MIIDTCLSNGSASLTDKEVDNQIALSIENTYKNSFYGTSNKATFNWLSSRIKFLGKKYYDYFGTSLDVIITTKEDIYGISEYTHSNDNPEPLKKGYKYFFFTGDGFLDSSFRLFNLFTLDEYFNSVNPFLISRIYEPVCLRGSISYEGHLIFDPKIFEFKYPNTFENDYIKVERFNFSD